MSTARLPRPIVPRAIPWTFPDPHVQTLDNGLTVWAFDLPGQYVASAQLVLPVPLAAEEPALEGVATMCAVVADEGTTRHPDGEITEMLEDAGAVYDIGVGWDATTLSIDVPVTRLGRALGLFAEIVQQPDFAATDVARHVDLRLSQIEHAKADPGATASRGLRRVLVEPACRASRPAGGVPETVTRLDPAALHTFRERQWRPEGAVLVVGGELPPDTMGAIDAAFGPGSGWAGSAERTIDRTTYLAPEQRVVHLIDRPGAVQSQIRIVGAGIDRTDPRFAALQVAAVAMGGSFLSRLNRVLREERGYTYGVGFANAPRTRGGSWAMSASVRADATVDALDEARAIMAFPEPFGADETADAVDYLVGIAPLRYDTAGGVTAQAAGIAGAGLPPEQVNRHFAAVAQVSPETASAVYRDVVVDSLARIVVVGDADSLTPELERRGYTVETLDE